MSCVKTVNVKNNRLQSIFIGKVFSRLTKIMVDLNISGTNSKAFIHSNHMDHKLSYLVKFSLRPSLAYTDKKGTSSRRLATTCDMSSRGKRLRLRYFTIFPKMLLMTFCALEPTISTIRPSNSVLCLQIAGYKLRVPSCLHYTGK